MKTGRTRRRVKRKMGTSTGRKVGILTQSAKSARNTKRAIVAASFPHVPGSLGSWKSVRKAHCFSK